MDFLWVKLFFNELPRFDTNTDHASAIEDLFELFAKIKHDLEQEPERAPHTGYLAGIMLIGNRLARVDYHVG